MAADSAAVEARTCLERMTCLSKIGLFCPTDKSSGIAADISYT